MVKEGIARIIKIKFMLLLCIIMFSLHLSQRHERLEVDPHSLKTVDIGNIIKENERAFTGPLGTSLTRTMAQERPNSEDFVDDPEVPPLM